MMAFRKSSRGFTLIELMITLAIVGVLVAVAYPVYTNSMIKGRRAQGRTALVQLLQQQERYMTQRNSYLAFSTAKETGVPSPNTAPFKTFSGDTFASSYYVLSAVACSEAAPITTCVKVTASPRQADPEVGDLTMTSIGEKSCTGSVPRLCWPS
ncbi:type IV pilin protein [Verminephrobacter eiseniae]|uniref:type IV pilin protein n=1 Tax=Verminephrobacter eiseniae TaxID=364317 RepID=UPI0010E30882|nr:type IV pilin protein [Verminephrobacter eiseniae]KAB7624260.1 type IV pilin protein [Verminephrobacter sp. Larva24]MCW5230602.1 type IV pilin protein [Verminephrobacter eiseniae]MCW5292335.1 type IV pilin protein [Verminephrobacter eiseniae]MCW8183345.1 type IV pilin protein [Verminephrobacter eiseniae]MCW8223087.1 type IV pilin protein [Verminephrobacter eiseniae]